MDEINIPIVNTMRTREHVTTMEKGSWTLRKSERYMVSKLLCVNIKVLLKHIIVHLI